MESARRAGFRTVEIAQVEMMTAWTKLVAMKVERSGWTQEIFRGNCKRLRINPHITGALMWCENKREKDMAGIFPRGFQLNALLYAPRTP